MFTYQDLVALGDNEKARMDFTRTLINQHKSTAGYKEAQVAEEYARHQNRTMLAYQKMLYTVSGKAIPDNWSANYKLCSNFFNRFIVQQNQFLLGNGTKWEKDDTAEKLGDDFDTKLQEAGKEALVGGVSFGFFNLDHLEVFSLLEFAPLYDEENGALMAGVRFWQIDGTKPLRATLYEIDGYTDYMWKNGEESILQEKRKYKETVTYTDATGVEIYDGENYETFPIVPFYGNPYKQSELVGLREQIDAYDLIKSGACNTIDEASMIYWTISNAGGMDDIDLAQFLERIKTVRAASVDDGEQVQAHSVEAPVEARETILDRIRKDLYRDYMALDTDEIAGGAVTATQIRASYEPMNNKADQYEYCVLKFVKGILQIVGIDDNPTWTRSYLVNQQEEIQTIVQAAEFLDQEYLTEKILTILGDGDKAEEVMQRMIADEINNGFTTGDDE